MLLEAAAGYRYDAGAASMRVAPVVGRERFRAPFVARDGWGTPESSVDGDRRRVSLRVAAGELRLSSLAVPPGSGSAVAATPDDWPLPTETAPSSGRLLVEFERELRVAAGSTLAVTIPG